MRSLVLLVASLLCLGGGASASTDFRFPAVFNFGDSNSDTGGRVAAGFESILPPYGATFFGTPSGRFCDGRLIIDFLSTLASRIPLSVRLSYECNSVFLNCAIRIATRHRLSCTIKKNRCTEDKISFSLNCASKLFKCVG
jgi:hypothetical protein